MMDVAISIPIGILYNICTIKLAELSTSTMQFNEKTQKTLVIAFLGGLVGYILVMSLFSKGAPLENRGVKYGVFLGSSLLILNTLFMNWNSLENDTKLFVFGFLFFFLIGLSYKYKSKTVHIKK